MRFVNDKKKHSIKTGNYVTCEPKYGDTKAPSTGAVQKCIQRSSTCSMLVLWFFFTCFKLSRVNLVRDCHTSQVLEWIAGWSNLSRNKKKALKNKTDWTSTMKYRFQLGEIIFYIFFSLPKWKPSTEKDLWPTSTAAAAARMVCNWASRG